LIDFGGKMNWTCEKTYIDRSIKVGDYISFRWLSPRGWVTSSRLVVSISGVKVFCDCNMDFYVRQASLFGHNAIRISRPVKSYLTVSSKSMPKNFNDILVDDLFNIYSPAEGFCQTFSDKNLFSCVNIKKTPKYIKFLKVISKKPRSRLELFRLSPKFLSGGLLNKLSTLLLIDKFWYKGTMYYVPGPALDNYCRKYQIKL
jgi:hypothetical protein